MTLLSLETATHVCSVALHENGILLGCYEIVIEKSHSEWLTVMIDELLRHTHKTVDDLNGIALSAGPGSYTGLRIGSATAKGLCFALDIPLYDIDTLKALALQITRLATDENAYFCPMIDARRMEVFTAIYDKNLNPILPTQSLVLLENSLDEWLQNHKVIIFGNGAAKCKTLINHSNLIYLPDVLPSAKEIGTLAFETQKATDVAYFEPLYVKEFYTPTKK